MKVGKSAETYQVGAHFKALIKAILVAPSRTLEKFFSFRVSLPRCDSDSIVRVWSELTHLNPFRPATLQTRSKSWP